MAAVDIEDKFYAVLATMLKVPRATLSAATARDNGTEWDSLKHMHLMLALEEEFGIEFSDAELSDLASAGVLLDAIGAKLGR